jgi:hypothetical protein
LITIHIYTFAHDIQGKKGEDERGMGRKRSGFAQRGQLDRAELVFVWFG